MRGACCTGSVPRLAQDLCCGPVAFMGEGGSLRGAEGEAGPLQSEGKPAWSVSLRPGRGAGAQFPASRAAAFAEPEGLAGSRRERREDQGRPRRSEGRAERRSSSPSSILMLAAPPSSDSPRALRGQGHRREAPPPPMEGRRTALPTAPEGLPTDQAAPSLSSGLCLLEPSGLGLRVTEHASVIYSPSTHGSRQLPARVGRALPTMELSRAAPATPPPPRLP